VTPESNALPVVLNMVICDGAHRDLGTGKWSLLGIFSSVTSSAFPTTHPQMIAYIALSRAFGRVPLRFQIVPADRKDEVLYTGEAELTVTDPVPVVDLVIAARSVNFKRPGEYLLQLFSQGQFLAERPILVMQA
jgi:hypothetical protein